MYVDMRKISLLKDDEIRKRIEEVIELVDVGIPNLWIDFLWGFKGM